MAGQPHNAFRRSCETAGMLQLSMPRYRFLNCQTTSNQNVKI
jgi:hypothetical protein